MGFGQVDDVDIVADAGAVGSVVVVAEYCQLLADSHCRLRDVRDEVVRHSVWQLTDECRGVCADRVEVAENDALDGGSAVDVVVYYLLVDFLCVAVRRCGLLMRGILGDGEVLGFRLAVDGARRREDDALDIVFRHELKEIDERDYIVAVVEQRLLDALAHGL